VTWGKHQGGKQDGLGSDVHRQFAGPPIKQEGDMVEEETQELNECEAEVDRLKKALAQTKK